jgi:two-component system, response regulator YesN
MKLGLEVVVVDDEQPITDVLCSYVLLTAPQARVHSFADPKTALDFVKNNPIDLLVTDYRMPLIDGMQLAAAAPAHARKVLLTGFAPEIAENQMKALNVTVLGKPVPLKVLGKIIAEEMGRGGG